MEILAEEVAADKVDVVAEGLLAEEALEVVEGAAEVDIEWRRNHQRTKGTLKTFKVDFFFNVNFRTEHLKK